MIIRKEKREALAGRILKSLEYVKPEDEIVLNVSNSILNLLDQISIDSHDDYGQFLLRTLLPNVLFNEFLVSSEDQLVYMILMDFLRLAGFKIKLSVRKALPLQVAEVLYLSENQQDLEEEDIR